MAKTLADLKLADILPPSISSDAEVSAAAKSLDAPLQNIASEAQRLPFLSAIEMLPEDWLDALAWQWHVDYYETNSIEAKRTAILSSIAWHRRKGTPSVVQEVVETFFQSAEVEENWEYGGTPYHFRVCIIKEPLNGDSTVTQLVRAINNAKNVRSWLDELSFYRECRLKIFYAMPLSIGRQTSIYPRVLKEPAITGEVYYAMPHRQHKKVAIKWQIGTD